MKHSFKATLLLIFFFLCSQVIGLAVVYKYIDTKTTAETGIMTFTSLPYSIERPQIEESSSYILIAISVLIGTLIALFLIKYKQIMVWKIWYFLAVIICLSIAFTPFIMAVPALIVSIILASLKLFRNTTITHNLTELFIYAGIAAIFVPIMNTMSAIILLIIISIYDIIAVWHTKHMITLAEQQSQQKIFAGFAIPYTNKIEMNFSTKITKKHAEKPIGKKSIQSESEGRTAILGGGDIAFPLLFTGAIMKQQGALDAAIIAIFAATALLILLLKAKKGKYYPAMPYITAGCLAGYALTYLI